MLFHAFLLSRMKNSIKDKHIWLLIFAILVVPYSLVGSANGLFTDSQCYGISRGREFVIGFTENLEDDSRQLSISVVTFSDQDTEVTISSKHQENREPFQETVHINAFGFQKIHVPGEYMMSGTERSLKGIKITATSDVSVYGLSYKDFSTDGFLSIPTDNLGKQYVVVTPEISTRRGRVSLFAIIGAEDATSVQVTYVPRVV